ncbi:MAG: sugar transferase [Actinomycetota bacterium]
MRVSSGATFQFGLATSVFGLATLHANVLADAPYDLLRSWRLAWWVLVAVVLMAGSYGLGLPELPTRRQDAVSRALLAVAAAVVAVSVFQLSLAAPLLPRAALGLLVVVAPIWSVIGWNLSQDANRRRRRQDRVFLVAKAGDEAASLVQELQERPESPAALVGVLPVDQAHLTAGGWQPLVEAAEAASASVVVLDTAAQSDDGIVQQAAELHRRGRRVRTLALFYEGWLGKLPVAELARVSLLFDIGEIHRQRYVRTKRIVDIVVAVPGLVALATVAPVVWSINRFANRGPLLFAQPRVGRDGSIFTIYKFRTMVPRGSDGGPSAWTTLDDPRITAFGGLLRRSHLDELPQMVNILKGELSLVGPRPEQPHYVDELRDKIPFYDVRHLVRPGLTGWAQVKMGYAADETDALEKLQYDFYYLRRQGLSLDARIFWRTARGVLGGEGR